MENTLENKAKFFAQYWGQEVLKHTSDDFVSVNNSNNCDNIKGNYLLLNPLSSITDEDALECYNLHFLSHLKNDIRPNESRINFCKKHIVKPIEVCIPIVTDYLRSKSYALPYMGLSVDKQIEYGWVKLTTNA